MTVLRFSRRTWAALLAAAGVAWMLASPGTGLAIDAYYNSRGVAIEGTDPVAYFTEGRPVEGSPEFSHHHAGVTWHFASAANRDAFAADPGRYAPQSGPARWRRHS